MKKLLSITSSLIFAITVLSGCTNAFDGNNNSLDENITSLSFTYGNIYNHIKDKDGNKIAFGLWNGCYLDQRIFKAANRYIPKYFISGDKITFNVKGEYAIEESYPSKFKLDQNAVVSDVSFDFADVMKIKVTDIEKNVIKDEVIYAYDGMTILDSNIITSRDGNFIAFEENEYEDLYISIKKINGQCDSIVNIPCGLYSFDPREINNRNIKIDCLAFNKNIVYDEERILSSKQYNNSYIRFSAFYLENKNIKSGDFNFVYNSEEFYIKPLYFDDVRFIYFMAVPLKLGNFKIDINAFGFHWMLNINVLNNDVRYDKDIDFKKYDELKMYLDGIKYHEFTNPYPGLVGNSYYESFDQYKSDYKKYLMDSCYYPSYFPSAPKSEIMRKDIKIVGDKNHKLDYGCEKSSILSMDIRLAQIDPGCTMPMDIVEYATYHMVKLDDVFKFNRDIYKELVLLKYQQVEPIIYENNGITFYLLKKDDFISAFFKDNMYLYGFAIQYDMSKKVIN